jgi:hypothetical protein
MLLNFYSVNVMSNAIPTQFEGFVIDSNDLENTGSIEALNTIFSDKLSEYNTARGISIINTQGVTNSTSASIVFYGGSSFLKETLHSSYIDIAEISQPPVPDSGVQRLFVNSSNNTICFLKSDNKLVTLSPLTTKGDTIVHNGTTEVRLPVGTDGQILSADSASATGLSWISFVNTSGNGTSSKGGSITLFDTSLTSISFDLVGSFFNRTINRVASGPSSCHFVSKSRNSISAAIARISSCPGISSEEQLEFTWSPYIEPEISKSGVNYNGNYTNDIFSVDSATTTVALSGTNWTTIYSSLTGIYILTVNNTFDGPAANFVLCKNLATLNSPSISRITSSPNSSNSQLRVRWQSNAGVQLGKTGSSSDGNYLLRNLLDSTSNTTIQVTLTGTTPSVVSIVQQRFASLIAVSSATSGAPFAIFSVTKNDRSTGASIARIASSPGVLANEQLSVSWASSDSLKLSKSSNNYNGIFDIVVLAV